jgi:hypothetical protein
MAHQASLAIFVMGATTLEMIRQQGRFLQRRLDRVDGRTGQRRQVRLRLLAGLPVRPVIPRTATETWLGD